METLALIVVIILMTDLIPLSVFAVMWVWEKLFPKEEDHHDEFTDTTVK